MNRENHEADLDLIRPVVGLPVGTLEEWERDAFDRLCAAGLARHSYEGVGGFLGLAKVRLSPTEGERG